MKRVRVCRWRWWCVFFAGMLAVEGLGQGTPVPEKPAAGEGAPAESKVVYVLPIRDEIEESMAYQVRRGVKEAMEMKADALVLHMDTPGGKGESMEDIMEAVGKFEPREQTYTLVDPHAFSAGAFISAATRHIYMTPGSVIGAAAPIIQGSEGPKELGAKFDSAYAALIRATAEVNGHDPRVFDAMVNKRSALVIDGETIKKEGDILTLTTQEATRKVGKPPKPLLAAGEVPDLDALVAKVAGPGAKQVTFEPTGYEVAARYVTMVAPFLLTLGMLFAYMEFQTPGFGIFGVLAAVCFVVFFFGHYVAGISGYEPLVVFLAGVALVLVELLVLPGTLVAGIVGLAMIFGALMYAMVDRYPGDAPIPSLEQLAVPFGNVVLGLAMGFGAVLLMVAFVPRRLVGRGLEAGTLQGTGLDPVRAALKAGDRGVATTPLRPAGTARFGQRLADVVTEGGHLERGQEVEVVAVEGMRVVVRAAAAAAEPAVE